MNYVLFQLISLTAIFIFAMEYFLVLLPFCNPACPSKVKGIDEDMFIVLCLLTVWLAQSGSGLCWKRVNSLIALPASAASIKHPGNCSSTLRAAGHMSLNFQFNSLVSHFGQHPAYCAQPILLELSIPAPLSRSWKWFLQLRVFLD